MNADTTWMQFLSMGGYGLYVWSAYGVCAAVMLVEPWMARRRHRRALVDARLLHMPEVDAAAPDIDLNLLTASRPEQP